MDLPSKTSLQKTQPGLIICRRTRDLFTLQIVIDIFIWSLVCIPVLGFFVWGKPFGQGFFCDDPSIKYPYRPSTVSIPVLLVGGLGIPLIIMVLTEVVNSTHGHGRESKRTPLAATAVKGFGIFLFGTMITKVFTEVIKFSVGRLRPNFLDVCKPDFSRINCSSGYVTEYTCTNTELDALTIRESRLAFPSGHASFAMFCAVYTALYMQDRFQVRFSHLLKPTIQFSLLLLGVWCGVTRIPDYKHSISDVVAGSILGIVIAWLSFDRVARPLLTPSEDQTENLDDNDVSYSIATEPETPTPLLTQDHVISFSNKRKISMGTVSNGDYNTCRLSLQTETR